MAEFMDEIIETIIKKIKVNGISLDSRKVGENFAFIAIPGHKTDGKLFIEEALERKASVIVTQDKCILPERVQHYIVSDARKFASLLAEAFYDYPARKLTMIGVTGTNGKTTISYLIESVFKKAGRKIGRLGTINYSIGERLIPADNTTPDPVTISSLLAEMVKNRFDSVVMEVSSHSIAQKRVFALDFDYGVFTNCTSDHLDYHQTRRNYMQTKKVFLESLGPDAYAVLNRDTDTYRFMSKGLRAAKISYGRSIWARVRAQKVRLGLKRTSFEFCWKGTKKEYRVNLPGEFNVQNALAALTIAHLEKIDPEIIAAALDTFQGVPGRCEMIPNTLCAGIVVDYAHTTDSMERILKTFRSYTRGKLVVVFGCGGDRDKTKRRLMGRAAARGADFSIITSDNPRSENPMAIIGEIVAGFGHRKSYEIEQDRAKAIQKALDMAQQEDVVLILGKGHENYQQVGNTVFPFSDRGVVLNYLKAATPA